MAYTTTDLITAVKAIASIPSSQNLFTTADFLRFANRAMHKKLIPLVLGTREEYWVQSYDHSITADRASYVIPSRAIGGKLRDVLWVSGNTETSLPRLEPENIYSTESGRLGFYLEGSKVMLSPTPTTTADTLRLKHFRRPNTLVAASSCGLIESIDTNANTVTLTSTPETFTNGVLIDFVQGGDGHDWRAIDQEITGVSGTTINFVSLPSDLEVGDYVCIAGESCIPQIPLELLPILEDEVAKMCRHAQGKKDADADKELEEDKREILKTLTPRVDGEPKKIIGHATLLNHFRRGR
ncbi:hypothetical protein UFOVP1351_20 [uncultured Caudovirales phage]|uniref:Uncharacterized protein n=1 Tax=uncultured Caudovirales phage TaxID=2100421 RepID=A0A6J5RZM0_9CAUD|nr:hypothetical protein UFOVP1351_20 [uncultured Caudovirales phage]